MNQLPNDLIFLVCHHLDYLETIAICESDEVWPGKISFQYPEIQLGPLDIPEKVYLEHQIISLTSGDCDETTYLANVKKAEKLESYLRSFPKSFDLNNYPSLGEDFLLAIKEQKGVDYFNQMFDTSFEDGDLIYLKTDKFHLLYFYNYRGLLYWNYKRGDTLERAIPRRLKKKMDQLGWSLDHLIEVYEIKKDV